MLFFVRLPRCVLFIYLMCGKGILRRRNFYYKARVITFFIGIAFSIAEVVIISVYSAKIFSFLSETLTIIEIVLSIIITMLVYLVDFYTVCITR
jgi:hypothetical protein